MIAVPESHAERSVHDYGYEILFDPEEVFWTKTEQIRCFQRLCPSDGIEKAGIERSHCDE